MSAVILGKKNKKSFLLELTGFATRCHHSLDVVKFTSFCRLDLLELCNKGPLFKNDRLHNPIIDQSEVCAQM